MSKSWMIPSPPPDLHQAAQRWGVPPLVAQLLINRGVGHDQSGLDFRTPSLKNLHPPGSLPGAARAAELLVETVRAKRRILLYGDYDVDGTTGLAILWHVLTFAGAEVSFYVPHRIEEGYGLSLEAVQRLVREGAQTIVSVDCGITAVDVAESLRDSGVTFIITDHHAFQATLPRADAIVHPALDETYPNPHLSGAGVAFKLAWAIAQQLSGSERVSPAYRELMLQLLPLAALGTIADVVPLIGENRIIARHGLAGLSDTRLTGLQALIASTGLAGRNIDGYDAGFKLAPRINAAGRMGHARLAVELLTRASADRAREIALYLSEHNRSRQSAERQIIKEAREIIERDNLAGDTRRAIVLAKEGWHAGVIGIAAARLVDLYRRPTVMIALTSGEGQGSARGVPHFDLSRALGECGEHLLSHGGHAMAAGLRIAVDKVNAFREAFVQLANNRLTGADLTPRLRLDAEVSLKEMALATTEAIISLGPFGLGNPRPKLATGWVELAAEPRCVGQGQQHLQALFRENGVCLKGIGFGLAGAIEDLKHHRRCRIAFEPLINDYEGRRTTEMQMLDFQFPGAPSKTP